MKVYRKGIEINGLDIMEYTYSGKDMGERSLTATIKSPVMLGINVGDYVTVNMNSLLKSGNYQGDYSLAENFYVYNQHNIKKRARRNSVGDAFETTVTFHPRQYELGLVQMRDFITEEATASNIIYTGFENVTFYGGAKMLLDKIIACLNHAYENGSIGGKWSYDLAESVDETKNTALNQFQFAFNGNSVMDALLYLNKEDYCNTTFFINERTIYVGYKRPYLCKVTDRLALEDKPLILEYGKTSHLQFGYEKGGLFNIEKSSGSQTPITRLYAYGSSRNLNRYYCSDRISSGRFVNKLMLPSFSEDGRTDFYDSPEGVAKYGIREGTKTFEDIYPSLRNITYGDLRKIKYVLKVRCNADDEGKDLSMKSIAEAATRGIARIQCYKVVDSGNLGGTHGVNTLIESWPEEPIAVSVHAAGKIVKTIIYTDESEQSKHDPILVKRNGVTVPGAAFLVHDYNWLDIDGKGKDEYGMQDRILWFEKPVDDETWESLYPKRDKQDIANIHRIIYEDTFWLTDVYKFESYDQEHFNHDGYSAYCWARFNSESKYPDSVRVNEVVYVEPIVLTDNALNLSNGYYQRGFDLYLRDCGFQIDEQNDFGEMVHAIIGDVKISFIDGMLAGKEYNVEKFINDSQTAVVSAYDERGQINNGQNGRLDNFFLPSDNNGSEIPSAAFDAGAMWRLRLIRTDSNADASDLGIIIPTKNINAKHGDHVVMLDIQMPDVYIRAAEERLLIETKKYIERVDKGDVQYSVSIDNVRFNQIPAYALQMREGLNVRIYDDDIEIGSRYDSISIFESASGESNTTPATAVSQNYLDCVYPYVDNLVTGDIRTKRSSLFVLVQKEHVDAFLEAQTIDIKDNDGKRTYNFYSATALDKKSYHYLFENDEHFPLSQETDDGSVLFRVETYSGANTKGNYTVSYHIAIYETITPQPSDVIEVVGNSLVEFEGDYEYDVAYRCPDNQFVRKQGYFLKTPEGRIYNIDEYEEVDAGHIHVLFVLPASYNVTGPVYFGMTVEYLGEKDNTITLFRVDKSNVDAREGNYNRADLLVDSVTIKVNENTRNAADRRATVVPEPTRMIQATLKPKVQSSPWANIADEITQVSNEHELQKSTIQAIVNSARKNYINLLDLRNNIFDPDGTCTDVFLQTMMLQVGADSMNYMLEKTKVDINDKLYNFVKYDGKEVQIGSDTLHHYVYNQGSQGGTWKVSGMDAAVTLDTVNPAYYIAIKASKNNSDATWVVSPVQHAVNEDTNYWYFNYGIITLSDGTPSIMETRGNAYMYGDNLVCGKISDLAKRSWFDLTRGEFVLGDALSFTNGRLNIKGSNINDSVAILQSKTDTLQNQIDRVVNSYFQEGAPRGVVYSEKYHVFYKPTYETVCLDWIQDYEKEIGKDWTLMDLDTQKILLDRHLGDTYTDVLPSMAELSDVKPFKDYQYMIPRWFVKGNYNAQTGELEEYLYLRSICTFETKPCNLSIKKKYVKDSSGNDIPINLRIDLYNTTYTEHKQYLGSAAITEQDAIDYPFIRFILYAATGTETVELFPSDAMLDGKCIMECDKELRNTDAGKTYRWCDFEDTSASTYHWHEVADSDAVRALSVANEAKEIASSGNENLIKDSSRFYGIESVAGQKLLIDREYDMTAEWGIMNAVSVTYNDGSFDIEDDVIRYKWSDSLPEGLVGKDLITSLYVRNVSFERLAVVVDNESISVQRGQSARLVFKHIGHSGPQSIEFRVGHEGNLYACKMVVARAMTQQGSILNEWKPNPQDSDTDYLASKYLRDAMQSNTDVIGGIILTDLLMMKDSQSKNVLAGMSGNQSDDVVMWAGGNYSDAVNGKTPVRITKRGTNSKIGPFSIIDDKTVRVTNAEGSYVDIKIGDPDGNNSGLSFYHHFGNDYIKRIKLSPDSIEDLQSLIAKCGRDKGHIIEETGSNLPTSVYVPAHGSSEKLFTTRSVSFVSSETQKINISSDNPALYDGDVQSSGTEPYSQRVAFTLKITDDTTGITLYDYDTAKEKTTSPEISVLSGHKISITITNSVIFDSNSSVGSTVYYEGGLMQSCYYYFEIGTYYTSIGRDGMFSFFASDSYLYYSRQTGFVVKISNKILRMKDDQIFLEGLTSLSGAMPGAIYMENGYLKVAP